jgi:hypothetical protein
MSRAMRIAALAALAAFAAAVALLATGSNPAASDEGPANNVLAQQVAIESGAAKAQKRPGVSGGVMSALRQQSSAAASIAAVGNQVSRPDSEGCRTIFQGRAGTPDNIRVNQDCTLRRQAEEAIEADPNNQSNLLAMQNDNLVGFNHCGYDWSFNTGRTWGSQAPPFYQALFATSDTADACSDPTVGWDTQGNSYIGGVFFELADVESAVWVMKSNAPLGGTAFHTPAALPFQEYLTTPVGEVVSSNDPNIFHDKELMEVDNNPTSPKKDNVYMTWTLFEFSETEVGGHSPIAFSQSTDGGATWSEPVIISGSSVDFCTFGSDTPDDPNACDQDQGSHPIAGPDGTIYVAFGNANTPNPGENQVLTVSCPPAEDCVDTTDWTAPTRVGDLIGTHPIGDPGNAGGCPVGRQCLPPNGYRVPEFTSISIANHGGDDLTVAWSDFRNGDDPGSTCGPLLLWSAATPPCNNDVFYAYSTDGGATWSETVNVSESLGQTAQWQPWHDGVGGTAYVMFYDRSNGNCEFDGCQDITLAAVENALTATPTIRLRRITTSSMPNLTPATNPVQAGFLGDYPWVDALERTPGGRHTVHLVWADTRPTVGEAPEEDIYYARMNCTRRGICDPAN